MVLAIGNEKGEISEEKTIPTESPKVTVPLMIDYFKSKKIDALGIASFGPLCLDVNSDNYGSITSTPKEGWTNFNIVRAFKEALNIPIGFDTDVNGSCLGEVTFGGAKNLKNVVYLTVGTGIGAGIMTEGKLLHGNLHSEAGHIMLRRHVKDTFEGCCPFHKDCFEGLASGPAMEKRWGTGAENLPNGHEAFSMEAWYIAQAIADYIMILAPERIIIGGGVMNREELFPLIRSNVIEIVSAYLDTNELKDIDNYIVPADLNGKQGILGCFVLGSRYSR